MITLGKSEIGGSIYIPSSKSQTIRACLIALAARGRSIIHNPLYSADTRSCFKALESLGCTLEYGEETLVVDSTDAGKLTSSSVCLDCENSGTTTYLLYGIAGTLGLDEYTVTGDEQLQKRPIRPLAEAYSDLGLDYDCPDGCPPVTVTGHLQGGHTSIECRTSQYLSSLLLSLPLAFQDSVIDIPLLNEKPYVSMTMDWLDRQGIRYSCTDDLQHFEIEGRQKYRPFEETIKGDFSSASFFACAAAITGCTLTLKGLDINDKQGDKGLLDILEDMGARVTCSPDGITIQGPRQLRGGTYDLNAMPDCLPVLSVLGAVTSTPLKITNVRNARIKETDRIACMHHNLSLMGLRVEEEEDGLTVYPGQLRKNVTVSGFSDHRIIMAMAILSLVTVGSLTIDDESASAVTFPTFFTLLEKIKTKGHRQSLTPIQG